MKWPMKNIILELAGDEFKRLRLGVGKKPEDEDLVAFVLEPFPKEDQATMKRAYDLAAEAAITVFTEDIQTAMGRYNGKKA